MTIAIIVVILIPALYAFYARSTPSQSGAEEQKLIADLKEFNGMTTYFDVQSVLGDPGMVSAKKKISDGTLSQVMEWSLDAGKVKIVFRQKSSTAPQKVVRVEYTNRMGEEAYLYKLLTD